VAAPGSCERLLVAAATMASATREPLFVLEPTHWIMQTRQFANLKRRAERDSTGADQSPSGSAAAAGSHAQRSAQFSASREE
jgi:hypothetical protein